MPSRNGTFLAPLVSGFSRIFSLWWFHLKSRVVRHIEVSAAYIGQRIDNFLFREYKNVPKSYIYRIIRSGEVRVNSGRVAPSYKLSVGDQIRIPPIAHTSPAPPRLSDADADALLKCIIYEDDEVLVY